jgi:hypothetical protein
MSPFVNVLWTGTPEVAVRDGDVDWRTSNGTTLTVTTTLSVEAVAGDLLWFYIGTDGSSTTFDDDRDCVYVEQLGTFRHTSHLCYTTLTSGDITAGSVAVEFTASTSELFVVHSFETSGLSATITNTIEDNDTDNRTAVTGPTLTSVTAGSVVLALCVATPDSGTNGLTVTDAESFTQLGDIVPDPVITAGHCHIYVGYLVSAAGGSVKGPDFANDSSTGPGNVTNPGLYELEVA